MILVTLTSVFFIVETFITRYIIQIANDSNPIDVNSVIVVIILMALSYFLYFLKLRSDNYSSYRIKKDLNSLYWENLYGTKLKDYSIKKTLGDSHSYFTQKVGFILNEYFGEIYEIVFNSTFVILGTAYMFFTNYKVAIVSTSFYLSTIFLSKYFSKKNRVYMEKINSSYSSLISNIDEVLANSNQIYCYDSFEKSENLYSKEKKEYFENLRKYEKSKLIFNTLNDVITRYRELAVLILVIFNGGTFEVANLFMLLYLSNMMSIPFVRFSEHVNSILSTKGVRDEIDEFEKNIKNEINYMEFSCIDDIKVEKLNICKGGIEILNDFSLEMKKSGKYMLYGKSGSGKSTAARAILALENIKEEVRINGQILKDETQLYGLYSFISSNDSLFNDTVKNNITLFDEKTDENKYMFITWNLDLRLSSDLVLDDEKLNISGGEKQKILVARALYNDYDLIIIDEALAAIDRKSADEIVKSILQLENKTVMLIDHNIDKSLMEEFDEVITL